MENGYLTAGELALMRTEGRNSYGYCGDGCGYGYYRGGRGMAATGVALGAGLGGAALIGLLLAAWGNNTAAKARLRAAENASNGNARAIDILAQQALAERQTRETWQNTHAPSMTQYVDVRAGAGAGANALATAEALALLQNGGNGLNSAIGGCNYLRVARVSGSRLCGCDTCEG